LNILEYLDPIWVDLNTNKPKYDTSMYCGPSLKIAWVAKETSLLCLHPAPILHPTTRFLNTSIHITKICGSTKIPPGGGWFHFLAHGLYAMVTNHLRAPYGVYFTKNRYILRRPNSTIFDHFRHRRHRTVPGEV